MKPQRLVQDQLRKLGLGMVRLGHQYSLEQDLLRVIDDCDLTTVVDIGAHHGGFGLSLRASGYTGPIVSFEPSSASFEQLARLAGPQWRVVQSAIGTSNGTCELNLFEGDGQLNSVRPASEFGVEVWEMTPAGTETLPMARLDTALDGLGLDPARTLVKIDTQGLDFEIVRWAPDLFDNVGGLLLELAMFGLYEGAPTPGEVIDTVRGHGLNVVGFFPVHPHPRPLVPVEFDALFARSQRVG